MPSPISPLNSFKAPPSPPLSTKTFHIAGILTTVYGLAEIPFEASEVVCLWLLHPRLDSQKDMVGLATTIVNDYYTRVSASKKQRSFSQSEQRGLIAVTFDARNHGTRAVDAKANEVWKTGNENHASDMFSIYSGTAQDLTMLIDFLPAYIASSLSQQQSICTHFALGVSLGGHSTWLSLLHEPRIAAGVVVVGCPDYVALMADRARLSKLSTWLDTTQQDSETTPPPGNRFIGSQHFPGPLLEVVQRKDPAAVLSGQMDVSKKINFIRAGIYTHPPETENDRLRSILHKHLGGKRILCLSGASDKLVPYRLFEPFMSWLKKGLATGGWGRSNNAEKEGEGVYLEDLVFEKTAHELTEPMMQEVLRFIYDSVLALDKDSDAVRSSL